MANRRIIPVDMPREFLPHELFFSLTDAKGKILGGNSVFTRISAYSEEELVGQPHNIIRHPDMPRCVFQVLWDYLLSGRTIAAYVKNMAADGLYYWVLALVMPHRDGFVSVRMKPSTPLFDAAREIYRETLDFERVVEERSGIREGINQSTPFLLQKLADAGFDDYDAFMRIALSSELVARQEAIAASRPPEPFVAPGSHASLVELRNRSSSVAERLGSVFSSLNLLHRLSERLSERHESLEELGPSLSFLALNANLSASRLGSDGATLSVISRDLCDRSNDADGLLKDFVGQMGSLKDNARRVAFDVAVAQLEAQVCQAFSEEILADGVTDSRCVDVGLEPLNEELRSRCHTLLGSLESLLHDVERLSKSASRLVERVAGMKIVQLNGRIEIAGLSGAESFQSIFDDVARLVASACDDCSAVLDVLADTRERLDRLSEVQSALRDELEGVASAVTGVLDTRCNPTPVASDARLPEPVA